MNNYKLIFAVIASTAGFCLTSVVLTYQYLLNSSEDTGYARLIYAVIVVNILFSIPLGKLVDRSKKPYNMLIYANILSGISIIPLFYINNINLSLPFIAISTLFAGLSDTIIFKILPVLLDEEKLKKINISLNEINAWGFLAAPIIGPILLFFNLNYNQFYLVNSFCYFLAALVFKCFFTKKIKSSLKKFHYSDNISTKKTVFSFQSLIDLNNAIFDARIKKFIISYFPYTFSYSAFAFTLAVYTKHIVNGDEMLFAIPVVAIFAARILTMKFIRKKNISFNYATTYAVSLVITGFLLIPVGLINNLILFTFFEFMMGVSTSIVMFASRMYIQTNCDNSLLGEVSGIMRSIFTVSRLIAIPVITFFISENLLPYCSLVLGIGFIFAAFVFYSHPSYIKSY